MTPTLTVTDAMIDASLSKPLIAMEPPMTNKTVKELVERLCYAAACVPKAATCAVMREAAATLTQQTAEIETLREAGSSADPQ